MTENSADRVYLSVPFKEKEKAKAAARNAGIEISWDKEAKAWWIPGHVDSSKLNRWKLENTTAASISHTGPREEFAHALKEAGLIIDGLPEMDKKLRRVPVSGDRRGKKSGSYFGFYGDKDGMPMGYIHNFKTGQEGYWKSSNSVYLSNSERAALQAEAAQKKHDREQERMRIYLETATLLEKYLAEAILADDSHPYLELKGVRVFPGLMLDVSDGLKLPGSEYLFSKKGNLLIPVRDVEGKITSVQSIDEQGRKSFAPGGKVRGGFFMVGDADASPLLVIAEGYSTARTVHDCTGGLAVAVAFNAGNLAPVAQAMREKYPDKPILIAGDNDHHNENENDADGQVKKNVGREKAEEAAKLVGGYTVLPPFDPDSPGTDWNDLLHEAGRSSVEALLQVRLSEIEHFQSVTQKFP